MDGKTEGSKGRKGYLHKTLELLIRMFNFWIHAN